MLKQYRYIGKDQQKKGWVANQIFISGMVCYYVNGRTYDKELIENEPDIWEEVKEENAINKILYELRNYHNFGPNELVYVEDVVKKHLGITKENVHRDLIIHMGIKSRSEYIDHIKKLLEDRGLLLD